MPFRDVINGVEDDASDIQQLVADANGYSGAGKPKIYTALNDPDNPVVTTRNRDTVNQRGITDQYAGGASRFVSDGTGVKVNQDGQAGALHLVATRDGVETLTNKTFGRSTLSDRLQHKVSATLVSAATVDLTTATGDFVPISGSVAITALGGAAALDGQEFTLLFLAAGCVVAAGAGIVLISNFTSAIDSTLTVFAQGGRWIEKARTPGGGVLGVKLYHAGQSTSSGVATAVSWTQQDYSDGFSLTLPVTDVPIAATGKYAVFGAVAWAADNTAWRRGWVEKSGGVVQAYLFSARLNNAGGFPTIFSFGTEIRCTAGETLRLVVYQDTGSLSLLGGVENTHVVIRRTGT